MNKNLHGGHDLHRGPRNLYLSLACLALAALACTLDDILFPKTFFVTKTEDTADGSCSVDDCSLREAVVASNETPGRNTIIIPGGVYVLSIPGTENASDSASGGDLDITAGVDIEGDLWVTVIDANALYRIFSISDKVRVQMRGLTIQNGNSYTGGGIQNSGELTLIDSTVTGNLDHLRGGGIANGGTLTLRHAFISNNISEGSGGGIFNGWEGTLIVEGDSYISGNTAADFGGGIFNEYASQVEVTHSSIVQNSATNGGGIANQDELGIGGTYGKQSSLLLTDVIISNNSAGFTGGGIYNAGGMRIIRADFGSNSANYGGGIYSIRDASGDIGEATEVVFHDNIANGGGGLYDNGHFLLTRSAVINNQGGGLEFNTPRWGDYGSCALGSATLLNVTISGNTFGAGLSAACNVELTNVTIAHNDGAGINRYGYGTSSGVVTLRNSIIADNSASQCLGTLIVSDDFNLESGNTCGFAQPGDLINTDPMLDVLQGVGSTFLHPLLAGSPAIDAVDTVGCPVTDQRGAPRPFGPACDMGAYEFGVANSLPHLISPTVGNSSMTPTPTKAALLPTSTQALPSAPRRTPLPQPSATATAFIIQVTLFPLKQTPTATPTQPLIIFTALPIKRSPTPIQ